MSGAFDSGFYRWMGIMEEGTFIDRTIYLFFNYPPLIFKDEKGDLVGSLIQFLYSFANYIGYQNRA